MKRNFTDRFVRSIKPAPPGKRVEYYDTVPRRSRHRQLSQDLRSVSQVARQQVRHAPIVKADRLSLSAARKRARE